MISSVPKALTQHVALNKEVSKSSEYPSSAASKLAKVTVLSTVAWTLSMCSKDPACFLVWLLVVTGGFAHNTDHYQPLALQHLIVSEAIHYAINHSKTSESQKCGHLCFNNLLTLKLQISNYTSRFWELRGLVSLASHKKKPQVFLLKK